MSNEIGSYVVSIKAKIEGYQAEIEKIKKELSAVGKDTTIGKDVAAALAQVEKRVSALGKNTEIRISNDSQILRLRDNVIGVEQAFIDLGNVMQRVDSLQMDSELSNQYHNLVNQINALNQQMSASFEQAFSNARASSQSFADFMKSLKLNPSTMSLDEMNEKVEAYGSAAQQAYEKAQAAANEAATTVNELNSKLQITPHIDMAQLEQLDTLIRTTLDPTVEGNGRAYEQIINRENVEQVKRVLQSLIESSNKASEEVKKQWITTLDSIFSEKNFKNGNGFMTALNANLAPILRFINGRNASLVETANISEITTKADMARFLATTVPTDQTIQAVQDLLKNALAQLPDSLQGNLLERIIGIGANGQNVQAFRKEIDAIFGEIETRAKQLNTENAKLTQALVPATSKLNAANQKANEAAVNNNTAQANIETYRNIIQQHENEINTLRQEIEQLRTELAAITEKAANTPSSVQQSGKKLVEQHSTEGMAKAREEAQMYADQLEKIKGIQAGLNNLGNFIKRWFSIYAVARMVNQAFQ